MHLVARSSELLVIFAIAWAALFAVSTHFENEKVKFLNRGAHQVFVPFQDAASKAAEVLYRD